jgi:hypothetical protein
MSTTLSAVLDELWPSPTLRGMPDGTCFEHGWNEMRDHLWARLTTPWFPEPTTCEIFEYDIRLADRDARAFVDICDARLSDLRMRHWMAMFWPDLDEVPA